MAILLTLTGNHPNMGDSQKFDTQEHFDSWINEHKDNFLPNLKVANDGKSLQFGYLDEKGNFASGSGSGIIESVLDSFDNSKPESADNRKN